MRRVATRDQRTETNDRAEETAPDTPRPRQFGLRMAVLAGVIAATGGTTTSLGTAVNTVAGPADTTCCGGGNNSIVCVV